MCDVSHIFSEDDLSCIPKTKSHQSIKPKKNENTNPYIISDIVCRMHL